jgi:c(7)-type cytochrome triheme protein
VTRWWRKSSLLWLVTLVAWTTLAAAQGTWQPLARDGVHDPKSPAIGVLQEPGAALSKLPPDTAGNFVRWVEALEKGVINPRTNIKPETVVRLREDSIVISKFGSMPAVTFPPRQHTLWLDCSNCHESLFVSKAGANKFRMQKILEGEQCGVCHGAVAFPLTECKRCHNTSNASLRAKAADAKR